MLLEMITKRILDFDYQLPRLFGKFINQREYVTKNDAIGEFDVVFCHREGLQDSFNELLTYTNSNTKIVVDITTESGNLQSFLDCFIHITQQNSNEFYLIIDSDINYYINKVHIPKNVKILQGFDLVFFAFLNELSDNTLNNNNQIFSSTNEFLSLNNSCRLHRVLLLSELLKRNLPMTNCSFLFSTGGGSGSKFNKEVYIDCVNNLFESNIINKFEYDNLIAYNLPKNLDYDLNTFTYIHNQINHLYHPILNLVTENVMGMSQGDASPFGTITFTEKIIKPFLAKQIPLFIALPGLQEVLRNLGFDLFDDLIVTSYEMESNPIYRIKSIVTELQRLLQIDLIQYKKNNQHRFDYNYNLLEILTKSGEEKVKSFLYEEILK